MSTRIKNIPIPFNEKGDLISIINRHSYGMKIYEWKANTSFYASLKCVGVDKGPYSSRMTFVDQDTGKRFNMHMNDFVKAVEFMRFGILTGMFCYTRSHNRYGVRLLK